MHAVAAAVTERGIGLRSVCITAVFSPPSRSASILNQEGRGAVVCGYSNQSTIASDDCFDRHCRLSDYRISSLSSEPRAFCVLNFVLIVISFSPVCLLYKNALLTALELGHLKLKGTILQAVSSASLVTGGEISPFQLGYFYFNGIYHNAVCLIIAEKPLAHYVIYLRYVVYVMT